jgi:hypothetical protein
MAHLLIMVLLFLLLLTVGLAQAYRGLMGD